MDGKHLLFSATIVLPFHVSKKNGRPIFNGRLVSNPRTIKAKKFLLPELQRNRLEHRIYDPISDDLHSVLTFVYSERDYFTRDQETHQLRRKHTVADTSNLVEFIHDSLQDVGIIKNDSQICSIFCSRTWGPRTEVKIELYPYKDEPIELSIWKTTSASSKR